MGKTTRILALFLCIGLTSAMIESVTTNSISINGTSGSATGNFSFNIQSAYTGTHVFTLFGDGTFSCLQGSNVRHNYESSTTGYTARTYYVKPYDNNPPPDEFVTTGGVTSSGGPNTAISMSGEIDLLTSWAPAGSKENYFIVAFKNNSSPNPIDGCIEFIYHDRDITINNGGILEYHYVFNRSNGSVTSTMYNSKLKWDFANLNYGETRYIYVPAIVNLKAGEKLNLSANYKVNCRQDDNGGGSGGAEVNSSFMVLRYPHDPNFKIVDRKCLDYNQTYQQLEYTVGFFNDGENFAHDVFLTDKLPPQLDPSTMVITESEYLENFHLAGSTAKIDYINIMLPGINQDNPDSYSYQDAFSYLKFAICTELNPALDYCIVNTVDIQFDSQPIFQTEKSIICKIEQCPYISCAPLPPGLRLVDEVNSIKMEISPNPFSNILTIELNKPSKKLSLIEIDLIDVSGKNVNSLYKGNSYGAKYKGEFDLSSLPSGMYFIRLKTDNEIYTEKVFKF